MTTLSERLKTATVPLHREMEGLPFFAALTDGSLPLDSYVGQLRAFAILSGTLERTLESLPEQPLRDIQGVLDGRFQHLLDDLDTFADRLILDIPAAVEAALALARSIRRLGVERPATLVGHIYTLGGTILGNRVHLEDVRRILGGRDAGGAFYAGFVGRTDDVWRTLTALIDAYAVDSREQRAIVDAAQESFRRLADIHAALYPLPAQESRRLTATSLNPEAGSHPIPEDLREVRAALAAGRRCREEFPYFDARYGARGRRYTSSDVAWLATLSALDPEGVVPQVTWLADLLARLGMPRFLLERQLEILVEELVARIPERQAQYRRLDAGISALRAARLASCPGGDFAGLARIAEEQLAAHDTPIANLGGLVVSALADEQGGIPEAAASLESWLTGQPDATPGAIAAIGESFRQLRTRMTLPQAGR